MYKELFVSMKESGSDTGTKTGYLQKYMIEPPAVMRRCPEGITVKQRR
jgi:hypothetical protein